MTKIVESPTDADILSWNQSAWDSIWLSNNQKLTENIDTSEKTSVENKAYFVKGTLILTDTGLVPIENINVGTNVWTHRNRWRPVISTSNRKSKTVIIKGNGQSGLETNLDHHFWARESEPKYGITSKKKTNGGLYRENSPPENLYASDIKGKYWSTPANISSMDIPDFEIYPNDGGNLPKKFDEHFFWLVGTWVGQQHFLTEKKVGSIQFIGNAAVEKTISTAGFHYGISKENGNIKFTIASKPVARWLETHFGYEEKRIPAWLFGCGQHIRRSFIDGFIRASGETKIYKNGSTVTSLFTNSKYLAYGIKILSASLDFGSLIWHSIRKKTYRLSLYESPRGSFIADDFLWGRVRTVTPTNKTTTVYNLVVEEDNSYVADSIVIGN